MDKSEEQDEDNRKTSGGPHNWRAKNNSEKKFFNKPNKGMGFMNKSGRSAANDQWRSNANETRFFGEPSTSRQEGNWRSDKSTSKFFGERSASSQGTSVNDNKWKRSTSNQFNKRTGKPPPKKHVTFDTTELLTKEHQELVTFLVENLTDFTEFLAPPLPSNTAVQLVLIVEKLCLSKVNIKFSNVILSRIHKNFMQQLEKYFVKLSLDEEDDMGDNELFWKDPESFWNSLLVVLENIIDRLQKAATLYLGKVIKTCLVTIMFHKNSHGICVNETITKKLGYLSNRLANLKKISNQSEDQNEDDYQSISVYPNPSEVLTRNQPFLRQNIIDGSYMSVEHYLDTHFRLLREDFLAPLREAICNYKDNLKNKEYVNITEFRIYTNAHFIDDDYYRWNDDPAFDFNYIGNNVRRRTYKMLDPGDCKNKYVNNEEAFMPGTLLCFSSDNFESMFFGTASKLRGTRKGIIDVLLLEDVPFLFSKGYTMLECSNYFNTYCLVLKALRSFSTYSFPMENIIVNVVNAPKPPGYLTPSTKFTIDQLKFTVLDYKTWPTKEELNLNEMQYEAFKQALTSKCAIIQGPPGTGKTHLGLKIAQTLIQNNSQTRYRSGALFKDLDLSDDEDNPDIAKILNLRRLYLDDDTLYGPILVVAYTNHALDQFLEGLMPYTQRIVRIGHMSKNEKLSQFTFTGVKRDGYVLFNYYSRIQRVLIRQERLVNELESVLSYSGIFNVQKLVRIEPRFRYGALHNWSHEMVISWLLGNSSTDQERHDRWEMTKEIENNFETYGANSNRIYDGYYTGDYVLTTFDLKMIARELRKRLDFKDAVNVETIFEDWYYVEEYYQEIRDNIEYLKWRLQHAAQHAALYASKPIDETTDLLELPYNDRWILYFHWLDQYVQHLKKSLKTGNSVLRETWEDLEDYKQREDSYKIRNAAVVGMTTSGAAKHRHLLENLKCRIVIVEEAAEVLESHIVISLTHHCQHLILIGDHQQLRPSTADYRIEKQYQLGISLFERLIRNGISYSTLGVQHRMRPEISRLIVPAIYENLEDHASVNDFGNINGIKHNVFFITHPHPEVEIGNSRRNPYEAKYLVALARHLILQGYDPNMITILTTYKGQMYEIIDEQKQNTFSPVKLVQVTVVDNFQGEENQIILLSLVRSNNQGSIGFLRVENRVCVALSRAKRGFYMIGNMEILTNSSKIWPKINDVLERNEQVGPGLQLACQLHPENVITAIRPEDFLKPPNGGCHLSCLADLKCGHICTRKCHVTDVDHKDFHCMEPCDKILCSKNHKCPKKCWERCGPCQVPMERLLLCGHEQMVPCSTNIRKYKCPVLVETLLMCLHTVDKPCHEDANEFPCPVEIEVVIPACGHLVKKKCSESEFPYCTAIVTRKMNCGHDIEKRCWRKDSDITCGNLCLKTLGCGHVCEKPCHYMVDKTHTNQYRCNEKCTKLKIGCKTNHTCDLLCSEPCSQCRDNIDINLPCGHSKTVPCHKSDRKYTCDRPCRKLKACGHVCYGKCHTTCDSTCLFKVSKSFPNCGHKIRVNCSKDLQGRDCMKCLKKKNIKEN